ncbi:MAG: hypothetical protein ACRC2R_26275 [Xenococcaceae cyanobacterium]
MLKVFRLDNIVVVPIALTILGSSIFSLPIARLNRAENETQTVASSAQLSIPNADSTRDFPGNLANDEAFKILGITTLGAGVLSLIWHRNQKNKTLSFDTVIANYDRQNNTLWIDRTDPKLRKKLLRLVHNDRSTANRLIAGANISHPDRSVDWLAEKVIYDLERDRL